MTIIEAVILGTVQGLTEFLPISSSGHLILARSFFGISGSFSLAEDAVLQLATVLAVLWYFRKDIASLIKNAISLFLGKRIDDTQRIMIIVLCVGTLPAIVFGLLLESTMETVFRNPLLVAGALVGGSLLMVLAEKLYRSNEGLKTKHAFPLGLFQALAIVPGVSRSGATISGGMILGLSRELATRVSFLLSVPILLGSGLKKLFELISISNSVSISALFIASLAAFFVGLFAIEVLLRFVRSNTLYPFIVYRCILAGLIVSTAVLL